MEGVLITDANGRKILSTQFDNPIPLQEFLQSNNTFSIIPLASSNQLSLPDLDSEIDSDEPWASTSTSANHSAAVVLVQIIRNGLKYVAPISAEVDPVITLTFLDQLYNVLQDFIGGNVTEASIKDNFDIVLELFEEMLSNGRPLLTESSQLKELVKPPSQLLKVAATVGIPITSATPTANSLLTSPISWRRSGLKYASNEIYFDVTETLSYILSSSSQILSGSVTGVINSRTKLSGVPDLSLSFSETDFLEGCGFHPCVRYNKWLKDKVVSFIPPDGQFTLMTYSLPSPTSSSHSLSTSPLFLLPMTLSPPPQLTLGKKGGTFSVTINSRAPPNRALTDLLVRISIGKGAIGVTASTSGGALPNKNGPGGRSAVGGSGRWDHDAVKGEVVWKIDRLSSLDRPVIITGQFLLSDKFVASNPGVKINFDSKEVGFSGLRIAGLKLVGNSSGEDYNIYKGVRITGKGEVEVRC